MVGEVSVHVLLTSAGGATQISPARQGWVRRHHNPERRRCGTPLSTPAQVSIMLKDLNGAISVLEESHAGLTGAVGFKV